MIRKADHLIETIREQRISDRDTMVRFDIKSLFTNVPTNKTLEIVGT